jgi:hypothetical protein
MGKRRVAITVAAAALVLAVLGVGAGAVMAQSGSDDGTPGAGADAQDGPSFLDRVAEKLGVEGEALEQAIQDVRNEDIDAAVARGDLTQEEADRLKERLAAKPERAGFGPYFHGGPRFGFDDGFPPGWGPKFVFGLALPRHEQAIADFLGVTAEQLREELRAEGASLSSVAEAHGRSRDELKSFILDEAARRLDAFVASGELDRERADEMRARLEEGVDELIDRKPGMFPGHRNGSPFRFDSRRDRRPGSPAMPDEIPGEPRP